MTRGDRMTASTTPVDSSSDVVGQTDRKILSRRTFLTGIGLGAVGGAGAAITFPFQALVTRGGEAALPAKTRYYLPAVNSSGAGIVITVEFEFTEGEGELFVNLERVELRHDLQMALRESMQTAMRLTDSSLAGTATHIAFETHDDDVHTLWGKSWEAGLTVALVGALDGRSPSRRTLVTGVVGLDGTLLPVGGIKAKAEAARTVGAETLLVPADQAVSVSGIRVEAVATITEVVQRVFEE